jgi:MFS superfamily sulfate permease-like transporter
MKDLLASIVVFLVALPLCMGIAIASGVPPAAGLITGIVGGIVVGYLAGAPLGVSGPAAGLTVVVWQLVEKYGIEALGAIVMLAGAVQFLSGALKLGQWFRAVSPSVIHGMLAGIGVLIFASQFHIMLDDRPKGSGLQNLISIPEAIYKGLTPSGDTSHHLAAILGVVTIASLVLWTRVRPKRLHMVPAPLVAVVIATTLAAAMKFPVNFVQVPTSLIDSITWPGPASFANLLKPELLMSALALAFIASAETLLCATAVDQMHSGPRANFDKELRAQGVGNLLCGLVGALPMTQVIVRSSANVESGGETRKSAILHGVWMLAFVAALPFVLRMIPTSALAAILVYTGYKLVNLDKVRALSRFGRGELLIYAATMTGIVVTDLLTGVIFGFVLAMWKLLYTFTHLSVRVHADPRANRVDIYLEGAATFIGLPKLAAELEKTQPHTHVHIHVEKLAYIDHACLELISNWREQHENQGTTVVLEWDELEARYHRAAVRYAETS